MKCPYNKLVDHENYFDKINETWQILPILHCICMNFLFTGMTARY